MSFVKREDFAWNGYLQPGHGDYPNGSFYAGLKMIEGDKKLMFEELLIKFTERLRGKDAGPWIQTNEVLRIGTRRLLWEIHNKSIENVKPAYTNFASRLRSEHHRHGIISFNWDLQAELALSEMNIPWQYDLTTQGQLPVIKPHGSINWNQHLQQCLHSDYSYWRSVGSTKLSFDLRYPLRDTGLDDVMPDINYTIFPGDSDLPETDCNLKRLWQDAACLINGAKEVVFIGYSFPNYDRHARRFFREKVKDKKVVIVNPSRNDLQKLSRILGKTAAYMELCKQGFNHCYYAQPTA